MKLMDCGYDKSTATHTDGSAKAEISLPWKAPEDAVGHEVEFRFSVVQDYSTFWTARIGNHTVMITETEATSTEGTSATSNDMTTTSTTVTPTSTSVTSSTTTMASDISTTTLTSTIATNWGTASTTGQVSH